MRAIVLLYGLCSCVLRMRGAYVFINPKCHYSINMRMFFFPRKIHKCSQNKNGALKQLAKRY